MNPGLSVSSRLFVRPDRILLEILSLVFLETVDEVGGTHKWKNRFFGKKIYFSSYGQNGPKLAKNKSFSEFLENFVITFWRK